MEKRFSYFLIGLATGAGVLALVAPKSGRDTRRLIANRVHRGKKLLARGGARVRHSAKGSIERVNGAFTAAMEAGKSVVHSIH